MNRREPARVHRGYTLALSKLHLIQASFNCGGLAHDAVRRVFTVHGSHLAC